MNMAMVHTRLNHICLEDIQPTTKKAEKSKTVEHLSIQK